MGRAPAGISSSFGLNHDPLLFDIGTVVMFQRYDQSCAGREVPSGWRYFQLLCRVSYAWTTGSAEEVNATIARWALWSVK
jgi:hypothetical protein